MRKLYEKNEPAFALCWIFAYIAGNGLAGMLGQALGVFRPVSAGFHAVMAAGLLLWVRRNGLCGKYGLTLPGYRPAQALFFLPLAPVALYKLFFSPALRYGAAESALFVTGMLCVGFLEELLFRGFLFRALEKDSPDRAIFISSAAFGAVHIVNLLAGQSLPDTIGQIIFALAVGFALAILFYKGKSLVPCIAFHGVLNALSVLENEEAMYRALGGPVPARAILIAASAAVLGGYSLWIRKHLEG